jgi:hypothetical protein
VVAHGLEEKVLDLLLARLTQMGLVAAGGKQRTDSTQVLAAVRDLNRLELVGESARALVGAAPHWLAEVIDVPGWSRRYRRRIDSWKMPPSKTKQDAFALGYARDGSALLGAVSAPGQPALLAAGAARGRGPALCGAAELHPHHGTERAGGGQAAGEVREGGDGLPPASMRLMGAAELERLGAVAARRAPGR